MERDPFGYFARKAAREAKLRNAAPYRIDDCPELIPDFEALEARLGNHFALAYEPSSDGSFRYFDHMTGHCCGKIHGNAQA